MVEQLPSKEWMRVRFSLPALMQFIFFAIVSFLVFLAASVQTPPPVVVENAEQPIQETATPDTKENVPAAEMLREKIPAKEEKKEEPKSEPSSRRAKQETKQTDHLPAPPQEPVPVLKPAPKIVYLSENELNERARKVVVNIFCWSKTGGVFAPASGSGVIVDPRGIILTNAHVAQYFLLEDYRAENFIECMIRAGSPAAPTYKAKLIFISREWLTEHARDIASQDMRGNGEKDYALLLVTGMIDAKQTIPSPFPFIPLLADNSEIKIGAPIFVGSYPAGFIGGITTARDLWLSTSSSRVTDLFSFATTTPKSLDLFSVAGTIGTQQGSSGGGMFEYKEGHLAGLISARTDGATTAERKLYGITIPYISADMRRQTGETLQEFLKGDPYERARTFENEQVSVLRQLLIDALER